MDLSVPSRRRSRAAGARLETAWSWMDTHADGLLDWVNVVNASIGKNGQAVKYKSGKPDTSTIMSLMGTLARSSSKRSDAEEASGEEAEYEIVDLELAQGSAVTIFIPAEGPIFGLRCMRDRTVYSLNIQKGKLPIIAATGLKFHFRAPPALG